MTHKIIDTIAAHVCIDPNNGNAFDASLVADYSPRWSDRHGPNSNDKLGWAAITKADRLVLIDYAVEMICFKLVGGKSPTQPEVKSDLATAQHKYAKRVWEKGLDLASVKNQTAQLRAVEARDVKAQWEELRGLLEPHADGGQKATPVRAPTVQPRENSNKAVLFVLIGWAERYEGDEVVIGNHKYLQDHPKNNMESKAFKKRGDGYYRCGIGRGMINELDLDVVFVARHRRTQSYRIVGIYRDAESDGGDWPIAKTRSPEFYEVHARSELEWPRGRSIRRWAKRIKSKGQEHQSLYQIYLALGAEHDDHEDPEVRAFEGKLRSSFVKHRKREWSLRTRKIRETLERDGKLRCEVPGCGFNFHRVYGELGRDFAVVHHKKPLASMNDQGEKTTLDDLVIVCANCHAMIHKGGECRPLDSLIPRS